MSRLTRDGTAEPVSRDQILRHARGQGNVHFPCSADHEQDWQPYPVDPYSAICDDHTYIHTYIHTYTHYTRGTSTVDTAQWYNHSTSTNTGSSIHCTRGTIQYTLCDGTSTVRAQARVSRYITRAGMYKGYKHGTSTKQDKYIACTSHAKHCSSGARSVHTCK